MERKNDERHDEPVELGVASLLTLGSGGPFAEKETTMLHSGISDE